MIKKKKMLKKIIIQEEEKQFNKKLAKISHLNKWRDTKGTSSVFSFFKISEDLFLKELLSEDLDRNKIQKYIDKGIDLNKRDEKGRTILYSLVAKRKIDAIRILIKNGILINDNVFELENILNRILTQYPSFSDPEEVEKALA